MRQTVNANLVAFNSEESVGHACEQAVAFTSSGEANLEAADLRLRWVICKLGAAQIAE
jgi:hypothetical protein